MPFTVEFPGTPIAIGTPKAIQKKLSCAVGAFANVISLLLTWYADSGSCITPPTETKIEKAEPGVNAEPPTVKLNVFVELLKDELISSNFN